MRGERTRYRGNHHPAVREDILALMEQDMQLRDIALARIGQLVRGEVVGRPLEARVGAPDLSDCRVLRFDTHEHDPGWRNITAVRGAHLPAREPSASPPPPRYCILYRLQDPSDGSDRRLFLQVLSIAPSVESAVYRLAGRRLNRPDVARQPRRATGPSSSAAGARELALREAQQRNAAAQERRLS